LGCAMKREPHLVVYGLPQMLPYHLEKSKADYRLIERRFSSQFSPKWFPNYVRVV